MNLLRGIVFSDPAVRSCCLPDSGIEEVIEKRTYLLLMFRQYCRVGPFFGRLRALTPASDPAYFKCVINLKTRPKYRVFFHPKFVKYC